MNKENGKKYDLGKLQKNYFEATVKNVIQANEAIKSAQNWLLILGLAELSFLGAIILQSEEVTLYIKVILAALLLAFVLFILGSVKQYKHLLSSARYYEELSRRTLAKVDQGQQYVNEIPEEIKLDTKQIKSDKITNILLFSTFCLIILAVLALIPFVFKTY